MSISSNVYKSERFIQQTDTYLFVICANRKLEYCRHPTLIYNNLSKNKQTWAAHCIFCFCYWLPNWWTLLNCFSGIWAWSLIQKINIVLAKLVQTLQISGFLFSPCANLMQEKIQLLKVNQNEKMIAAKGNAGNRNYVGCVYCFWKNALQILLLVSFRD